MVATTVMLTGLLADVLQTILPRQLFRGLLWIKRHLLLAALPMSVVVAGVYWPLILFAPHLILDSPISEEPDVEFSPPLLYIPFHIDVSLHGLPGPFLLLDFLLFEKRFSRKTTSQYAPVLAACIGIIYSAWVEYCASHNGLCKLLFTIPG